MRVLVCSKCGYERSSEDDGRSFTDGDGDTLICDDCTEEGDD